MEVEQVLELMDRIFFLELDRANSDHIANDRSKLAMSFLTVKTKEDPRALEHLWKMRCNRYCRKPLTERAQKAIEKFKFYHPKLFETL